ncbi:hypothetical protein ETD83_34000 [Actinomadura soli]|uniref:Uncharacterized protein n=1 Tax=Actinomadura soli TaxID=2508997 RepID=A0A5C4J1Z9_9ACTN|nr:hypothetical protein [Actinomadura soli]TMQ90758.1 hypothetical protein ETD83_34000 [Actinomadura soli]
MPRLILLGIGTAGPDGPSEGAARPPLHAPAGLLVEYGHARVGLDGGPGSEPPESSQAWLVRDEHGPYQAVLGRIARQCGMPAPVLAAFRHGSLRIEPLPVAHPGRAMHGYRITAGHRTCVWAPEFAEPPGWARDADLMFAGIPPGGPPEEAVGALRRLGVARLVLVRPPPAGRGEPPPSAEWGVEGALYRI